MQTALEQEFAALGEWVTRFRIGEREVGGWYSPEGDERVARFIALLQSQTYAPRSILECGCLEGGHTVQLARAFPKATVHAVDVRAEHLTKAALVCRHLQIGNVVFVRDDLDEPRAVFGKTYDAIFCVGLLYHLLRPDQFLMAAAKASPLLWLWTVVCPEETAIPLARGYSGKWHDEQVQHPLSAVRERSFFPSLSSLITMLQRAGYVTTDVMKHEMTANGAGPAVLICAERPA